MFPAVLGELCGRGCVMVTPQQLMDLPSAGMAEKALRKAGLWQLTPQEKIENALDDVLCDLDQIEHFIYTSKSTLKTAMEATCN